MCRNCSSFTLHHRHIDSSAHFKVWCSKRLANKTPLSSSLFVELITRLAGLYVLIETPQQNMHEEEDEDEDEDEEEDILNARREQIKPTNAKTIVKISKSKHICKVLMSPQQFEIFTSTVKHRYPYCIFLAMRSSYYS